MVDIAAEMTTAGSSLLVLVCFAVTTTWCMEEHIVMERAQMEDQESSATGYAYSSDNGGPTSYVHFADGSGEMAHVEVPYVEGYLPSYEYQYLPVVDDSSMHYVPQLHQDSHYNTYGIPSVYSEIDQNKIKYGYGKFGLDDSASFEKGSGEKHDSEDYASHGEKGASGYKHLEGWDKGKKGQHEEEDHKGWYGAKGGEKKGHHDLAERWGSNEESAKSDKGGQFKEAKGHKKGSKTSGYHKVYSKDEFKKDHEFYDKADKKGHFDKYGSHDAGHESKEGGFKKGGSHDSGYHVDEQGKDGHYDKGHHDEKDKGFKGEHGGNQFHKNYEEFVKKAGEHNNKEHEYKEDKGSKWY